MGRGEIITFASSDPSAMPNDNNRTANVGGVATFDYRRDSDSGDLEATARQLWAAPVPAGTNALGNVVAVDPTNNRAVVVAGAHVWLVVPCHS